MKRVLAVLLLSASAYAGNLDSRSLFLGIGLGAGMVVTRNKVAIPAAKATKKAFKKTAHLFHKGK